MKTRETGVREDEIRHQIVLYVAQIENQDEWDHGATHNRQSGDDLKVADMINNYFA